MRFIIIISILFFCCKQKTNLKTDAQSSMNTTASPTEQKVFFKNLNNGDTLISPFFVEMGVFGMKIKPAGEPEAGTGHHHIVIDEGFVSFGEIIPMDKTHLHYGKGDTIAKIELAQGEHTLTLQFANGMHVSYGEQFSSTINIYVK